MTGKLIELGGVKRSKLRHNTAALKQEIEKLRARECSMAMLLHAVVRRHGRQTFALRALEELDPGGVDVFVDSEAGRVVVHLTSDPIPGTSEDT